MVDSQNKGPQYKPNTKILNIGTPKKVPLISGNPHDGALGPSLESKEKKMETIIMGLYRDYGILGMFGFWDLDSGFRLKVFWVWGLRFKF